MYLNGRVRPNFLVDIEALYHSFQMRHRTPLTDNLTAFGALAKIDTDPLTWGTAILPPPSNKERK